ncbi:Probable G-protein coupled receptor Mth-like 3 [Gryllus bimaculatus]|nr:Probable G-protein coupled receptor Mth-like 3 [Gryllus bimaculatus]
MVLVFSDVSLSEELLLATKCCPDDEMLNTNLRECYKNPITSYDSSEDSVANRDTTNPARVEWLPGHLQLRNSSTVRRGHFPKCSSRLTLRLVDPPAGRAQLLVNGTLVLLSPTARGAAQRTLFRPEDFCMDLAAADGRRQRVFLLCPCDGLQCVSKCCAFGFAKTCEGLRCECVKHAEEWQPFHSGNIHASPTNSVAYEILEANEPPCPQGSHLWFDNPIYRPRHVLLHWWQYPNGHLFRDNLEKCGEIVIHNNSQLSYTTIGYCYLSLPFDGFFELGSMLHIPAAALLALTMITLATASEKSVSAHGWVHYRAMQCHIASLLVSNTILATYLLTEDKTMFCLTTPMAMYFSLVSAAFWLNVICVNMTCGFRSPKATPMINRRSGRRMFLYYSYYACGSSAVMTALTASMWYAQEVPHGWVRPTLMETRRCFWEDVDKMANYNTQ